MKKIAIISDVHSNLEALQAVLSDISEQGCDEIVCLGDTVGYGAEPEACAKLVREKCSTVILGNHDMEASRDANTGMGELAAISMMYTVRNISGDTVAWLNSLPMHKIANLGTDPVVFAHGAYPADDTFPYILSGAVIQATMHAMEDQRLHVGFFGHTHLISHVHKNRCGAHITNDHMFQSGKPSHIRKHPRIRIFNIGSVGQPRDHVDWRAGYAIAAYDEMGIDTVTLRRVPYDVQAAREKIIAAGLPAYLGNRLLHGWIPPRPDTADEPVPSPVQSSDTVILPAYPSESSGTGWEQAGR